MEKPRNPPVKKEEKEKLDEATLIDFKKSDIFIALKSIANTPPNKASKEVLSIWNDLGPLDLEKLIHDGDLVFDKTHINNQV